VERKLAAILCADVHGYSRLMGEDEEATLRTLTSHRKPIDSAIDQHYGRFVNEAGDSVLAEFASVVEAVNCAVEIQSGLKRENSNLPPKRRSGAIRIFIVGINKDEAVNRRWETDLRKAGLKYDVAITGLPARRGSHGAA
jgi:class 3 adenylate cyclase